MSEERRPQTIPSSQWSPSPQDGYVEHLERQIIELSKTPEIKVINVATDEVLTVVRVTRPPLTAGLPAMIIVEVK